MKHPHIALSAFAAVLVGLASGCVVSTTIKDAPRNPVRFASPLAAQTFYDAYLSAAYPQDRTLLSLSMPSPYAHRTVSTDNVRFNSAVQIADSNHDGVISEKEARAFAAQTREGKIKLSTKPNQADKPQ